VNSDRRGHAGGVISITAACDEKGSGERHKQGEAEANNTTHGRNSFANTYIAWGPAIA
jgi:hypothetical protein